MACVPTKTTTELIYMLNKLFATSPNSTTYSRDIIDILRLIRSENVGPKTFFSLIKLFGSASNALDNIEDFSLRGGKAKAVKVCSKESSEKEIEALSNANAKIISYNDPSFSELLKYIPDCPPILSYKGNKGLLKSKSVAIVGARNASINGKAFASAISSELARHDISVVSGLARGIDTAAHLKALPNTIAVIAGGIDHIYPPENTKLFMEIAEKGLIVAELPVGSVPLGKHFPQRNRIISGLSSAVVVVEAGMKSGSLITARFAMDQNREVFSVPGFPLDPRCQGSNRLIKEGAQIVESAEDLLQNLPDFNNNSLTLFDKSKDQIDFSEIKIDYTLLNEQNRRLIKETLSSTPVEFDDIIKETELPIQVIYTILLELELAGLIMRHPGNKFSLILK